MTTETGTENRADSPPEIGSDQGGSVLMLPGLEQQRPKSSDLSEATRRAVEARQETGLLEEIDAAMVSLALANASKLDVTVGIGRPSGRAKLLQSMSDVLEALPSPSMQGRGMLSAYIAAVMGGEEDDEQPAEVEELPKPDPPGPGAGMTETGVVATLRARHDAGLSTRFSAAHEALALMTARDLDRALTVGAPSGYALLANVAQTVLERMPRPETKADAGDIDSLLSSVADEPSPFTTLPPATHHPELDPDYEHEADEIAAVARAMGRHLMPWQYKAAAVATQYKLGALGERRYKYTMVLITVPRQSGKTDLTVPVQLHRALTRSAPASCWYTAQSGQDARKRMMELLERLEQSLLRLLFTTTRSNGAEGARVSELPGAHVTRFSPTFSALHGEHPHLVTLDEIWHFSRELGDALLGAIEPAQITLGAEAQTWMVSTMGTVASEWMNDLVDKGRAGTDPDLCYIEYSLPEHLDPADPESWPQFHPALFNTIQIEDLAKRAERAKDDPARWATFLRAYCNRMVASDGSLVDLAQWDDLALDVQQPAWDQLALAFEVAPGNAAAAVVAGWTDPATGRPVVRIVRQEPGTRWLIPYLTALLDKRGDPGELIADGAGPVGRFVTQLEDAGHVVRRLTMGEFGQASEAILDYAGPDASLIHDGADELRQQVAAVEVRRSNGVRRFSRDSPRPVPAIIAAALALYGHQHPIDESDAESIVL